MIRYLTLKQPWTAVSSRGARTRILCFRIPSNRMDYPDSG